MTGKPLGITGEVAEYEAIKILNLKVCKARQEGYDALRIKNKTEEKGKEEKMQIKGRVLPDKSKSSQRLGAIKKNKPWDSVILVLLDNDFEPLEIHEAKRDKVVEALEKKGSNARNERGQLSVSKFRSIATKIWTK